jgi:ATP-dependent helicase/nuclease subunit A
LGSANAKARETAAKLDAWSQRAREDAPFEFFTWLLGDQGRRSTFVARLGPEANDALDEFLALALAEEARAAPALQTFLDAVQSNAESIKRDLDAAGDFVRVMTVHAAKGLEAPIVFLPDTMADEDEGERAGESPKLLFLAPTNEFEPPIFLWPGPKAAMSALVAALALQSRQVSAGEHRRLLYVAMTRAAERLIVCGFEGAKGVPNGSWYAFAQTGLGRRLEPDTAPWNDKETILAMGEAQQAASAVANPPVSTLSVPEWLTRPPVAEAKLKPQRASAEAFAGEERRRAEGRYFHFLLETLAKVAPEARVRAAQGISPRSFAVDIGDAAGLRAAALAILDDAKLAPFFAEGSRGELSIGSLGSGAVDFRIDRLALVADEAWIADFKLGAEPLRPPLDYASQMAAYRDAVGRLFPNRRVRSFLVWSVGPKAAEVTSEGIGPGEAEKAASANALKGSHFLDTVER